MDRLVIEKLIELFSIMFLGYFLIAKRILKQEAMRHFSNLLYYVTMPAFILYSMSNNVQVDNSDLLVIIIMAFVVYAFLIGMGLLLPKLLNVDPKYTGLYRFMGTFGNVGFIGYPVIIALIGEKALFNAAIFNIPYNLFAYSLGVLYIIQDTDKKGRLSFKNVFNPAIVSTFLGLFLYVAHITLPTTILNFTKNLGSITTPLSLIVVGGSLYGFNLKKILKKRIIFVYSLIKLMILPTLFAFVLKFFGIEGAIGAVAVIIIRMPIAANSVILSQEFDAHVLEASEAVFVSTLLIGISVPYLAVLIHYVFMF